ncbi:MAG TPA: DegT/DnrJ/EryC1/StrS family aminotransferase [Acidimicrobiales bacterium]|nr:DegT/DnrJ/EryC1/StrS family aminotransferase [Acidimicrobiales bacterium]
MPFAEPDVSESDVEAVAAVLRSGWLTTGGECARLEQELAAHLGCTHVVATSSCTTALETAFAALRLGPGARVGVPTWTFVASALAPARHGARPVLLDVGPDDLNLAPHALLRALEQGLDAVVGVHFAGVPLAAAVHDMCAEHGVPLVEDAAHALGAVDHRGTVAGQGSVAACYSFYATKNLPAGEGGALATEDGELAEFARSYRLHGLSVDAWARYQPGGNAQYDLVRAGIKANLPDVLAAVARSQLRRFEENQARRRAAVRRYREALAEVPGVRPFPAALAEGGADHLMVVLLPSEVDRGRVTEAMAEQGIGTSVHFQPLHRFEWFRRHAEVGPGGTPVADRLWPRALSLPLHPRLRPEQVDRVCEALGAAVRRARTAQARGRTTPA